MEKLNNGPARLSAYNTSVLFCGDDRAILTPIFYEISKGGNPFNALPYLIE
jgi:hypothetical protein